MNNAVLSRINQNGIQRYREAPPSHYIFKLESFSLLLETEVEKYETNCFEAGGHNWRLVLYPNGKEKEDSEGHLSLFLAMAPEPDDVSLGLEVHVFVTFFVFDQVRDRYLMIQDDDMKLGWRFHKMKPEWGLTKLVSHDALYDPSNGYLVDDCCIFGAEVFVVKSSQKGESLSFLKLPIGQYYGSYTWRINKYSALDKNVNYSVAFTIGGRKWKLCLCPNGCYQFIGTHLSLFLQLDNSEIIPPKRKLFAKYILRLKDQINSKHVESTVSHWFDRPNFPHGFPAMILLRDLMSTSKGYLVHDVVIVEVKFCAISSEKVLS